MTNLNNKIPDGPCNTYVKINENCFLFIKGSTLLYIENVTCETSFHQKKKTDEGACSNLIILQHLLAWSQIYV